MLSEDLSHTSESLYGFDPFWDFYNPSFDLAVFFYHFGFSFPKFIPFAPLLQNLSQPFIIHFSLLNFRTNHIIIVLLISHYLRIPFQNLVLSLCEKIPLLKEFPSFYVWAEFVVLGIYNVFEGHHNLLIGGLAGQFGRESRIHCLHHRFCFEGGKENWLDLKLHLSRRLYWHVPVITVFAKISQILFIFQRGLEHFRPSLQGKLTLSHAWVLVFETTVDRERSFAIFVWDFDGEWRSLLDNSDLAVERQFSAEFDGEPFVPHQLNWCFWVTLNLLQSIDRWLYLLFWKFQYWLVFVFMAYRFRLFRVKAIDSTQFLVFRGYFGVCYPSYDVCFVRLWV